MSFARLNLAESIFPRLRPLPHQPGLSQLQLSHWLHYRLAGLGAAGSLRRALLAGHHPSSLLHYHKSTTLPHRPRITVTTMAPITGMVRPILGSRSRSSSRLRLRLSLELVRHPIPTCATLHLASHSKHHETRDWPDSTRAGQTRRRRPTTDVKVHILTPQIRKRLYTDIAAGYANPRR